MFAAFLWTFVAYVRGPHSFRRAFRGGDLATPAVAWRGSIFLGLLFVSMSYREIAERNTDRSPVPYLIALGGMALVVSGLVEGWRRRSRHGAE
jgi:hypothetical protein